MPERKLVERAMDALEKAWADCPTLPPINLSRDERVLLGRAFISALREPTESMADRGGDAFLDQVIAHESGDKTNRPFVRFWRAMIDEALRDTL